jgi:hypothetical protein
MVQVCGHQKHGGYAEEADSDEAPLKEDGAIGASHCQRDAHHQEAQTVKE